MGVYILLGRMGVWRGSRMGKVNEQRLGMWNWVIVGILLLQDPREFRNK